MGVHWVYDLAQLQALAETRQTAQARETGAHNPTSFARVTEGCDPVASMLEFYAPPQSPYFSYPSGRPSPYGEQTLCLLASLLPSRSMAQDWAVSGETGRQATSTAEGAADASKEVPNGVIGEGKGQEQRGFCALTYAEAVADMYGQEWDGYRDASIKVSYPDMCESSEPAARQEHVGLVYVKRPNLKVHPAGGSRSDGGSKNVFAMCLSVLLSCQGFLRNWYRGLSPPRTGADDCQANCFTRLAPLVALYCGDTPRLLRIGGPLVAFVPRAALFQYQNLTSRFSVWPFLSCS